MGLVGWHGGISYATHPLDLLPCRGPPTSWAGSQMLVDYLPKGDGRPASCRGPPRLCWVGSLVLVDYLPPRGVDSQHLGLG